MKPLHWTVYVSCAVLTTVSVFLLIVSDASDQRDFGRWGLATGLAAAIASFVIVADRFSRRICQATHDEVEHRVEEIGELIDAQGKKVVAGVYDQTEDIAEAVCTVVLETISNGGPGATPIRR